MKLFKIIALPVALAFIFLSVGCSSPFEPEYVKLYKCEASANRLDRNSDLVRKAVAWKFKSIPPAETREEEIGRRRSTSEAMTSIMSGDGQIKNEKLVEWYQSSYCTTLLDEFQTLQYGEQNKTDASQIKNHDNTELALLREVVFYRNSLARDKSNDVSCSSLKSQVEITYTNQLTREFKSDLENGLKQTIIDSSQSLKQYQKDHLLKEFNNGRGEILANEIVSKCSDQVSASKALTLTESISNIESENITQLRKLRSELDATPNSSCGDLLELYCILNIQKKSIDEAISIFESCERTEHSNTQCQKNPQDLYLELTKQNELEFLEETKISLEAYIQDPRQSKTIRSDNAEGNIRLYAETCKHEAIKSGLTGDRYEKYVAETCIPNARIKHVTPQIVLLQKVIARMIQLGDSPSSAIETAATGIKN